MRDDSRVGVRSLVHVLAYKDKRVRYTLSFFSWHDHEVAPTLRIATR